MRYPEAVEKALCFGWIDGILKRIDNEKHAQRFTPRKPKSIWSKVNKERAKRMINEGKMMDAGLEKIEAQRKADGGRMHIQRLDMTMKCLMK